MAEGQNISGRDDCVVSVFKCYVNLELGIISDIDLIGTSYLPLFHESKLKKPLKFEFSRSLIQILIDD